MNKFLLSVDLYYTYTYIYVCVCVLIRSSVNMHLAQRGSHVMYSKVTRHDPQEVVNAIQIIRVRRVRFFGKSLKISDAFHINVSCGTSSSWKY